LSLRVKILKNVYHSNLEQKQIRLYDEATGNDIGKPFMLRKLKLYVIIFFQEGKHTQIIRFNTNQEFGKCTFVFK